MAQKILLVPKVYEIGTDISQETFNEAVLKIADWFVETRNTKEPALAAKQALERCLKGVTVQGTPWHAAATASLVARIKSSCRFDIESMTPLRKGTERTRQKRASEARMRDKKRLKAQEDNLIPDEVRAEKRRTAKYGDNAHVFLSSAEERAWRTIQESYIKQFPELASVNAESELKLLCDLHVLVERQRLKMLKGERVDPTERASVAEDLQRLKKALGIHPDQLAKRVKARTETSIGAAAARLEAMGDYRKLRERFWTEELLQIYQMYMTPAADGLTYQLDEVGLFGMTRSKPHDCPKCGHRVFAGLSIEEIEAWLVKKGVLRSLDPAPVPLVEGVSNVSAT